MYERILVPTDGSEGATAAVDHAIGVARRYDAALHTIYIVETEVGPDAEMVGVFEAFEQAGQQAVDEVIAKAESADIEVVDGQSLAAILVETGLYRALPGGD